MIVEALNNAALLSFSAIGLYLFLRSGAFANRITSVVGLGLSYGLIAFLVTVSPLEMANGATIDTRAGPVIAAGIFGGPIAAMIAGAFGAIARWTVGGSFAISGTIVFGLYAAIGALLWLRNLKNLYKSELAFARLLIAAVLSVIAAGLMFFLIEPREIALEWLQRDLPLIAGANMISVALCGAVGYLVVASERQRVELSETLETLELAKFSGGIGTWTMDCSTETVAWDRINRGLHGIEIDGAIGNFDDWAKTVHPEDLPRVKREFEEALAGSAPFDTVYRVVLRNQTVRDLKGNAVVLRDAQNKPIRVVGINLDITDVLNKDRELEDARVMAAQAQKMDAIGKLTGGIAHDFNNLLAIILGNLEIIRDAEQKEDWSEGERTKVIARAISAAERGGELTRSMLAFAKMTPLEPKQVQINDSIREIEGWLARTIPESIKFDTILEDDPWPLRLDLAGFQGAVVNVIVNAMEAMPNGGELTVETKNVRVGGEKATAGQQAIAAGNYVAFTVSDTGCGIEPGLLPDIFEPFVSAKTSVLGSGLGLSMVKGFVNQSGGFIRVKSEIGVGTSVSLYFPVQERSGVETKAPPPTKRAVEPDRHRARILVAEDQAQVLSVVIRHLEAAGYQVDAAREGNEALELFSDHDLLLTDIVMPGGLLGPELANACRRIKPNLPVVFMTGYASKIDMLGDGFREDVVRLMKPIRKEDLLNAIHEALEAVRQISA